MIISSNLSFYHSRMAFFLQTKKSSMKKFSIVKRVYLWVDLSRSYKVGLSQGGSKAAMLCWSFTFSSLFLALFFCRWWTQWCSMIGVTFFKSESCYYASSTKNNFFSGVCSLLDWLIGKREGRAELEEWTDKLQHGVQMPRQRRAGQLVQYIFHLSIFPSSTVYIYTLSVQATATIAGERNWNTARSSRTNASDWRSMPLPTQ